MKNLLIGLVLGVVIGFAGSKLVFKDSLLDSQKKADSIADKKSTISMPEELSDVAEVIDAVSISNVSIELQSQPQTIEEYQTYTSKLLEEVSKQSGVIGNLQSENKNLERNLLAMQDAVTDRARDEVNASDIEIAKENMQASLAGASPEYAEVLAAAISSFESDKDGNITSYPESEALLKHYSEEPDFAWADVAKAYIQNYFASQADSNIQLVQLNCRKTYCEIYGFYSFGEELTDPRQAGGKIQNVFKTMQQAPGFSNLFTVVASSSISIDSENSYMTFHNFLRSNRK